MLINLNQGLWGMVVLACQDYFKTYLKLDPGQMTGLMSIVMFPWSVKIIYGLISDNVPLMGYKRKSYIMLMGFVQFISLASIYVFEIKKIYVISALLACASLGLAFTNVVIDAIMCV